MIPRKDVIMKKIDLNSVRDFINKNIGPQFQDKKIEKINNVTMDDIIKRKNPYLFRAKGIEKAQDFVENILIASLSSGEETTFGNFLEMIAIFVNENVYNGRKSSVNGIDLEFENGNTKHLVSIKSGPNWGNSSQHKKLVADFNSAKKTLGTSGGLKNWSFTCVEGCCYGRDKSQNKGTHFKYCGQKFWSYISGGNENLYIDIIEPLGNSARLKNNEIEEIKTNKINSFTHEFIEKFCVSGKIDWEKLIKFNSEE